MQQQGEDLDLRQLRQTAEGTWGDSGPDSWKQGYKFCRSSIGKCFTPTSQIQVYLGPILLKKNKYPGILAPEHLLPSGRCSPWCK